MRFERKYRIDGNEFHAVRAVVETHALSFRKQYPDRQVNNIYLDSPDFSCLQDNLMGAMNREKFRIRWYGEIGDRVDNPVLELKRKHGELGDKYSRTLQGFALDAVWKLEAELKRQFVGLAGASSPGPPPLPETAERLTRKDLLPEVQSLREQMVRKPSMETIPPAMLNTKLHLPLLRPVLMNSYQRSYYISRDHRFRLTIDRDLRFQGLDRMQSFTRRSQEDPAVIIEVKYEFGEDQGYDAVGQGLPFRVGKNSKYVTGMLLVGQV